MRMRTGIALGLAGMVVLLLSGCSTGGDGETPEAVDSSTPEEISTPSTATPESDKSEPTPRYTAVSSGSVHTCALREDATVECWGARSSLDIEGKQNLMQGQADSPGGERFVAISSGWVHTCGLREDGMAVCWGANGYNRRKKTDRGQARPPADEQFVAISSGHLHTCGLREDGTAVCWGDDEEGQTTPPEGERLKAIASGGIHTCGIRMDDTVVCWGLEPSTDGLHRFEAPPEGQFSSIDAAHSFTCGVRLDGKSECWGYVGDFRRTGEYPDFQFEDALDAISFGGKIGCGLRSDGSPYCWGRQLPAYPKDYRFSDISAGGDHICAIRMESGEMVCWGNDDYGQSSPPGGERFVWSTDGSNPAEPFPPYLDVSAGYYHTCALREDGAAVCWGAGNTIILNENLIVHLGQTSAPGDERFVSISSGKYHTCGLRADGRAICWGARKDDFPGGQREVRGQSDPPEDERFIAISNGELHTCGLREDGKAVCWGESLYAQTIPPRGEQFTAIASGRYNTCGLRTDKTVICWGRKPDPNGSTSLDATPEGQFSVLDNGGTLACGVSLDGQVECWGYRDKERSYNQYPPDYIEGGLKTISFGVISGCGIRVDDSPFCWGYWGHAYPKDQRFTDISVGWGHTCAIRKDDGGLVCWGNDDYGQASPPGGERFE